LPHRAGPHAGRAVAVRSAGPAAPDTGPGPGPAHRGAGPRLGAGRRGAGPGRPVGGGPGTRRVRRGAGGHERHRARGGDLDRAAADRAPPAAAAHRGRRQRRVGAVAVPAARRGAHGAGELGRGLSCARSRRSRGQVWLRS
ncbi:hypothetical protein QU38_01105, partial [Staphylococcus aureus]